MLRLLMLFAAVVLAPAVSASSSATYILQISSNLDCDSHSIALRSQIDDSKRFLLFEDNAFAALDAPGGTYTFDAMTCAKDGKETSYDIFDDAIAPVVLNNDQAYFGGRLIFKQDEGRKAIEAPRVLSDCTRGNSRQRGARDNNECRDGVGVDTTARKTLTINAYAPRSTAEELTTVRNALSLTPAQLVYLPLTVE